MAGNNYNFGLELANLDPETLKAPETRIKDAATGRKVFFQMEYDDQGRNLIRARHQAMLDGEPPYNQALRAQKGQGALTNVNFGNAKEILDFFMSGMIDLDAAVEQLLTPPLHRHVVPDDAIRSNLENILGSELTRMIRTWEGYARVRLTISHWFGAHGVGIGYFEDDRDWRPEAAGLGEFVIPNGTKASEDSIVVAGCRKYIELHQLYGYIRNEEAATAMGWNVDAVKRAMLKACPDSVWEGYPVNWQRLETLIRNNDLGFGYGGTVGQIARTAKVALIHLWCQEFDQTVTKYTTTVDNWMNGGAEANEPWLFMRPHVFPKMSRGMVFFPYGIGDNGTYHAISGILRAIFMQVNAINRCQSQMLDAAMMGCAMKIQPLTEASMSRMNVVPLGPIWLMPSAEHGQIITDSKNPDVAQSVMPVIADLRNTINTRAGQFQGSNSPIGGAQPEKTRFQVAAELESLGKVGATQELLWNGPWTRLLTEMTRRACREDYEENWPGGKEVIEFKKRLELRGFPLALLKAVDFDAIQANRAVGAGSGAARVGRLQNLRELAPEYDPMGRYNLVRDLTAAQLGGDYDLANRYMPPKPGERPPIDAQIADLENLLIEDKKEPTVEINQDHWVHLNKHFTKWGEMVGAIESGEMEQTEIAEQLMIFQSHCGEHLNIVNESIIMQQQAAEARQIYQQLSAITENVVRKAMAEQQRAMEEEMENGGQGEQVDPALQQKAIEARLKVEAFVAKESAALAFDQQRHEQDLSQKQQKFLMDMAHKDAGKAADTIVKAHEGIERAKIQTKQKEAAIELAKIKQRAAAANKPKPKSKKK